MLGSLVLGLPTMSKARRALTGSAAVPSDNRRGHQRRGRLAERQCVGPGQECFEAPPERIGVIRGENHLRCVAGGMEIDRVAPGEGLEDMSLMRVGMALDSHHHEPRPMRIARRVVNLPVIHLEVRRNELNEPVHHLLQLRRVPPESHGGEENRHITLDNCFGDLATGIRFHTHARCLDPATKATEAVGQFHFAQGKGLDLSTVAFEHVGQHAQE